MIPLSTTYDQNGLATTQLELSSTELTALLAALGPAFTFPTGKTATNIVSLSLSVDVNDNSNLQVITT